MPALVPSLPTLTHNVLYCWSNQVTKEKPVSSALVLDGQDLLDLLDLQEDRVK